MVPWNTSELVVSDTRGEHFAMSDFQIPAGIRNNEDAGAEPKL